VLQRDVARGRRDLAAIVNPMRLKPNASGRYLIAEGCFRLVSAQVASLAAPHVHLASGSPQS